MTPKQILAIDQALAFRRQHGLGSQPLVVSLGAYRDPDLDELLTFIPNVREERDKAGYRAVQFEVEGLEFQALGFPVVQLIKDDKPAAHGELIAELSKEHR